MQIGDEPMSIYLGPFYAMMDVNGIWHTSCSGSAERRGTSGTFASQTECGARWLQATEEKGIAKLRWGIKTSPQNTTYDSMLAVWQEADATPVFEHAWLFDHFSPIHGDLDGPCFEGWTLLAAYAAQTTRIRVGLM